MDMPLKERSQDVRSDRQYRPLVKGTKLGQIGCTEAVRLGGVIRVSQVCKKGGDERFQ